MTDHPSEWNIDSKDKEDVCEAYKALKKDYDDLLLSYHALRNVCGRLPRY